MSVTIVTICGSFKQQNESVTDWSLIAFSIAHSFLLLTAHYVVDVFVPNLQSVVVWLITPHALQIQSSAERYSK